MEAIVQKLNPLKHIRFDAILIDNPIFKLHHQVNFFLVLFGAVFIYGMNYLDENAIICFDGGEFAKQYCWLHGSAHIPEGLRDDSVKCQADQVDNSDPNERHTHYYLWVPFVLTLLLAVIKMPRTLWKKLEGGFVKNVIGDGNPEKICQRWVEAGDGLKEKARRYNYSYALCEMLNNFCLILCFFIVNTLFDNKFGEYGTKVLNHKEGEVDEKCNLFPTEVSCNVKYGGSDGNTDVKNTLCILSNNLFNQYYFLILWFWWVSLMAISAGGFVYRLAQILSSAVSKQIFILKTNLYVKNTNVKNLEYSQEEYFLLGRICQNLKGSQIQQLMKELEHSESLNTVTTTEENSQLMNDTIPMIPMKTDD